MPDSTYLDWPFFDPAHRRLAEDLRAWTAREIAPHEHDERDIDALSRRFVGMLGRGGWLRYVVPKAHGGVHDKLDVRSLCLCRETLGYVSGLADFAFAMQGLGTGSISLFGTPAQKSEYLPPVAEGRRIAAFALTEPDAGSDVAAMSTRATKTKDGWRLDGAKTFISNGGIADHYVVFARTSDDGARGISAFLVDAANPGLRIAERIAVIAPHPLARLAFENCVVGEDRLLGKAGEGFKIAMATLDIFRSTVGAASLGFARRALDEALTLTADRKAFGQPIA